MEDIQLRPAELVALLNQTLEYAYPSLLIVGELANVKIARGKWLYFDLKDEEASVGFFGTVYHMPGPLEDGMRVLVKAYPRLHERYGFRMQVQAIMPAGEGSIKKAADLLLQKLQAEGLFDENRKRPLPLRPKRIGLVTSVESAAYADFIKILRERAGDDIEVVVRDCLVQGERAPQSISDAIEHIASYEPALDVVVVTRGGGSPEDLAAFHHEQVVRAVAACPLPTLVAIGHEIDVSLAELAADKRASTPSNAAQTVIPDKRERLIEIKRYAADLHVSLTSYFATYSQSLQVAREQVQRTVRLLCEQRSVQLAQLKQLLAARDPKRPLQDGYVIVRKSDGVVTSATGLQANDAVTLVFHDGEKDARVQ